MTQEINGSPSPAVREGGPSPSNATAQPSAAGSRGPYSAEYGAVHHEDQRGFLFTVAPTSLAEDVADAMNKAAVFTELFNALHLEVRNCPTCKGEGETSDSFEHVIGQIARGVKIKCPRCASSRAVLAKAERRA